MATPQEKLADALDALRTLQDRGIVAIRSDKLNRLQRELLKKQGFLQDVMKGWYIAVRPDAGAGESTAWYASYWGFCSASQMPLIGAHDCGAGHFRPSSRPPSLREHPCQLM